MVDLYGLYIAVVFLWRFIFNRPRVVPFYLARRIRLLRRA